MTALPFEPANPAYEQRVRDSYDRQAARLVQMFIENFAQYEAHVGGEVMAAAPKAA